MTSRVYCGTFESENYWRERDLAKLPSLPDSNASRVVEAMDEMLFVFCEQDDRLLNARRMDDAHVEYLNSIGFQFVRNTFDLYPKTAERRTTGNPFDHLGQSENASAIAAFLPVGAELEPFAVVPGVEELAQRCGLSSRFPPQSVIRRVNTKAYSLQIRDRLNIENIGIIVESHAALLETGIALLAQGPFLIKDDYGVSGKGNLIITQESALSRVADYLQKQASQGRRIRFVLEPFLLRKGDFSCQFRVFPDGSVKMISVQHLDNDGLAFGMSCTPDEELLARLEREKYFDLMQRIGNELFSDGYFGDVCVDSMVLEDGKLVPLVEINARKSMSLIKHAVDNRLSRQRRSVSLTSVTASHEDNMSFAEFIGVLEKKDILFRTSNGPAIIPLSSGTLFPQMAASGASFRGKLYIAIVYDEAEQRGVLLKNLASAMEEHGFRVKN